MTVHRAGDGTSRRSSCCESEILFTGAYAIGGATCICVRRVSSTINELAVILSIAKGALYQWVYLRRIPFIKAGRCLRFDAEEMIAALRHFPTIGEAGKR
jgi:excisionase family DNA binding protein